jgi:hypothetical protein
LSDTTAPVVQFDNLTGIARSGVLDGLLTTRIWSDRTLGHNKHPNAVNDRLWLATGNNAKIGGDLGRRTLAMEIDPKMPNPHLRTGFPSQPHDHGGRPCLPTHHPRSQPPWPSSPKPTRYDQPSHRTCSPTLPPSMTPGGPAAAATR